MGVQLGDSIVLGLLVSLSNVDFEELDISRFPNTLTCIDPEESLLT